MRWVVVALLVASCLASAEDVENPVGRLKNVASSPARNVKLLFPGVRWVAKFGDKYYDVYGVKGGAKSGGSGDLSLRSYSLSGELGAFVEKSLTGKKPYSTLEILFLDQHNVVTESRKYSRAQLKTLDLPHLGFEKHKPFTLNFKYSKVEVDKDPKQVNCVDVERTGVINSGFFHFKVQNKVVDLGSFGGFSLHGGDKNLKVPVTFDVSNPKSHNFVQTWTAKRKSYPATLKYMQNNVRGTLSPVLILDLTDARVYKCDKNKSHCTFTANKVKVVKVSRD